MKQRVIYKITNSVNGKIYIGKDSTNRKNYYGSGQAIKNAILKYGKDNFTKEIIDVCQDLSSLNEREKYWISFYKSTDPKIGYNRSSGGDGDFIFDNMTEEAKIKMKENLRKAWVSPEFSERKKLDTLKYFENPENRNKQSLAIKKSWVDMDPDKKQNAHLRLKELNKKRWEDPNQRIKASHRFKENNPAKNEIFRMRMSKDRQGSDNPFSRKCEIDGKIYGSLSEAMKELDLSRNQIQYRIKSKNFKTYKYV